MTYTLFEYAKENGEELMVDQTEDIVIPQVSGYIK